MQGIGMEEFVEYNFCYMLEMRGSFLYALVELGMVEIG